MDIQRLDKRMKICDPYLIYIHYHPLDLVHIHLFPIEWIGYPLDGGGVATPSLILNTCVVYDLFTKKVQNKFKTNKPNVKNE